MIALRRRPPLGVGGGASLQWRERLVKVAAAVLLGLVGAGIGLEVGGHTTAEVGPFEVRLSTHFGLEGESVLQIPPLGAMRLDSHDGPLRMEAALQEVRASEVEAIAGEPKRLAGLGAQVQEDLAAAVRALVWKSVLSGLLGAVLLPLLLLRSWRRSLIGLLAGVLALAGTGAAAWATRHPDALAEPRYEGLLSSAPAVVGNVEDVAARFDTYSSQLADLVGNVTRLYDAAAALPVSDGAETLDVLQVADIHSNPAAWKQISQVVEEFGIELVVDAGDITDRGAALESTFFAPIAELGVPYVYVKGNHDSDATVAQMRSIPNVVVLDGIAEVEGLTLLGGPDPTFTPDIANRDREAERDALERSGGELAVQAEGAEVDLVVVHNPVAANEVAGTAPLVLVGHTHKRARYLVDGTRIMVEGSTGAAGLRTLDGDGPLEATMTILHLDPESGELIAWDDITLGGLGSSSVTFDRHLLGTQQDSFETLDQVPGTDHLPGRYQQIGSDPGTAVREPGEPTG